MRKSLKITSGIAGLGLFGVLASLTQTPLDPADAAVMAPEVSAAAEAPAPAESGPSIDLTDEVLQTADDEVIPEADPSALPVVPEGTVESVPDDVVLGPVWSYADAVTECNTYSDIPEDRLSCLAAAAETWGEPEESDASWDCRVHGNLWCGVEINGDPYIIEFRDGSPVTVESGQLY